MGLKQGGEERRVKPGKTNLSLKKGGTHSKTSNLEENEGLTTDAGEDHGLV